MARAPRSDEGASTRGGQPGVPPDYFVARARFRAAAAACGALSQSHPIRAGGPNGEALSIDVALVGDSGCRRLVVVSSGLHGVEGFLGSAIQTRVLRRRAAAGEASDPALLLIHALNPYGFAHLRRVNEDNVDLNRNFGNGSDPGDDGNSDYGLVDALLNPRRPPSRLGDAAFLAGAIGMIRRHGMTTLRQTIAEGQYRYPRGLFYGGREPCESTRITQAVLRRFTRGADRVLHLDLHSGLGPHGRITLLASPAYRTETVADLAERFTPARVARHDESGGAYRASGTLGRWCERSLDRPSYLFLCAEFGTYGGLSVLRALRAENQAHFWATPESSAWRRAKRRLADRFCPRSRRWRRTMLAAGVDLVERAIRPETRPARERSGPALGLQT